MKETFTIKRQKFTVEIHKEGKDYVATCLEIGTSDWGDTKAKALQNVKDCTKSHLQAFPIEWLKIKDKINYAKIKKNISSAVN